VIQPHPQGTLLLVRALPGARKEGVLGQHGDRVKVAVHAAPERGKANTALIEVLAKFFHLKRGQIELLAGETSQNKTFLLHGLAASQARATLDASL
jgi:uncharacterized protein (TIGR00251 family)